MTEADMKGFTLIEVLVIICIGLILIAIAVPALNGNTSENTVSFGINGITESRCIDGYKFVIGDGGQARQILDEFGKGVRCNRSM